MKYTINADLNSAIKQTAVLTGELNGLDKAAAKTGVSISKLSATTSGIKVDKLNQGLSAISNQLPVIGNTALDAGAGLSTLASGALIGGIAIVTTYLVGMAKELFAAATRSTALAEATNTLNKTLLSSTASVQGNIASLQSLVKVAQDVTLSDAARSEAINKLNKDYDSFNGKLNLANINTQESIGLINSQTDALVKQAEIKGLTNLITKEAEFRAQLAATGAETTKLQDVSNGLLSFFSFNAAIISETKDKFQNYKDEIVRSTTKTNIYTSALDKLFKSLAVSGDLFKEKTVKEKTLKLKVPKVKLETEELDFVTNKVNVSDKTIDALMADINDKIGKRKSPDVNVPVTLRTSVDELNDQLNGILTGTVQNFAVGFGEALGNAFSGGEDLFGSLFKVLGQGLKQLGSALIAYGISIQAFKNAFKGPGGAVKAIAAGIGLIAVGQIIQNQFKKGFATGGYVSGPGSSRSDSIPARLSNGEFVVNAGSVSKFGRGFLEAINNGYLPALANGGMASPSSNGLPIGGGQNLVLSGETITRGQDLLTVWRRATNTYSRIS